MPRIVDIRVDAGEVGIGLTTDVYQCLIEASEYQCLIEASEYDVDIIIEEFRVQAGADEEAI